MISIFSSFATDIITYENNRRVEGWPAFWIRNTLNDLGVEYLLHTGEIGEVIIEKDGNNQDRWIITKICPIPIYESLPTDTILISTLKDELNLWYLENMSNTIFLDIQWFLRKDFWGKKRFDCRSLKTKWKILIKATREEFSYLDYHEDTTHKFIITNWGDSIEILSKECKKSMEIKSWKFSDTIWAGDTFLASLCFYYKSGNTIEDAVSEAGKYTYTFLSRKNFTV